MLTTLDPKKKFPMVIIGVLMAIGLFIYVQVVTKSVIEKTISDFEKCAQCKCPED